MSVPTNADAFEHPAVMVPMSHPPPMAMAIVIAVRVAGIAWIIIAIIARAVIAPPIIVKRASAEERATAERKNARAEELGIRRRYRRCGGRDGNRQGK